jgi:predicted transglutaminase-like cysteine proteinase
MWWYFRKDAGNLCVPPTRYEVQVRASKARYEQLRAQDHKVKQVQDYARFVRDGLTPEVDETCRQIRQFSEADRLTTVAEINNVLAFAQRFEYAFDREDKGVAEYPKFPLETMVEDRGDCEDHAILAAACLARLGYEVRLVSVEYGTGPGHMALAVAGADELPEGFALVDPTSGRRFYYCEATTDAASRDPRGIVFRMGEAPEREKQAQLELIPITSPFRG